MSSRKTSFKSVSIKKEMWLPKMLTDMAFLINFMHIFLSEINTLETKITLNLFCLATVDLNCNKGDIIYESNKPKLINIRH